MRFALDPSLWTYALSTMRDEGDLAMYVARALALRGDGAAVPLAVVRLSDGAVVGSTRFSSLSAIDRRVEIGWTFYDPAVQGTAVNSDVKRLLLGHAFEAWRLLRVEFKADARSAHENRRRAPARYGDLLRCVPRMACRARPPRRPHRGAEGARLTLPAPRLSARRCASWRWGAHRRRGAGRGPTRGSPARRRIPTARTPTPVRLRRAGRRRRALRRG